MPKSIVRSLWLIAFLLTAAPGARAQARNLDMELSCPVNRLGEVTIWQAGRHGALDGAGAPGFLYAIKPQVVVVNNGPRKGLGGPSPGFERAQTVHYERLAKTPGIEGVWQGHLSLMDREHNAAENMIANLEDTADCQGHWIHASVAADGTYTITNSRNGFSRTYTARQARVDTPADTSFYAVSYVEAMASAASKAIAALKEYRGGERSQDGFVRLDLFEEIGRPGHFAIVETWRDQKAFDARGAAAQKQLTDTLQPIRVSDYDQRPYKTLSVGPAPSAASSRAISVVSHVDVNQDPKVPAMLRRLAEASRQEAGNLRFDVLQHTMRANHFTVVETWRDQQAFDAHVAAAHTKEYRDQVQPMTGSPLDERVYRAVQ